jgi:hypothetical protein
MKDFPRCVFRFTASTAIELLLFLVAWQICVTASSHYGHVLRGGVAFGLTTTYGLMLFSVIALAGNLVEYYGKSNNLRVAVHLLLLSSWWFWCWPSTDDYPVRGTAFFIMGALFYLCGVIVSNKIARGFVRRNSDNQPYGRGRS